MADPADEPVVGEYVMGCTGNTATGEYVVDLSDSGELWMWSSMSTDPISSMKS